MHYPHQAAILPVEPLFRSDDDFMPLQAADMLAAPVRRMLSGEPPGPLDWVYEEIKKFSEGVPESEMVTREKIKRNLVKYRRIDPSLEDDILRAYRRIHGDED